MNTSSPDPAGLLAELVGTPSVSGEEAAVAEMLAAWGRAQGLDVERDATAVRFVVAGRAPGRVLWLASHLDTVPPGDGWEHDPFAATVIDGALHGRGSSDAKASVAAMSCAAASLAAEGGPGRGRLELVATFGEETAQTTMPEAVSRFGRPDAAIVGEPTSLAPCVAQRGLLLLRLRWRGRAAHAGWAADLPEPPDNAVEKAARDLEPIVSGLRGALDAKVHPVLGRTAVSATRIDGGRASNVIPEACTVTLDIRTTPAVPVDEILAELAARTRAEIEVVSRRFLPCETPAGSPLLAAIRRERPRGEPFGSPTASDWAFLRDSDAVKWGPGDSRLSHTNRERVALSEVRDAAALYAAVARGYLS